MMKDDWQCIFSSGKVYETELIHGMLTENGIEGVVVNKQDSAYLFGEVELYVKKQDVLAAKKLIREIEE